MLVVVLAGLFTVSFTITLLAVSLKSIAKDLHSSDTTLTWVITGPMLAFGVVGPALGKAGDIWGHKRLFLYSLSGAAVFALLTASVVECAVAHRVSRDRRGHRIGHRSRLDGHDLESLRARRSSQGARLLVDDGRRRAGARRGGGRAGRRRRRLACDLLRAGTPLPRRHPAGGVVVAGDRTRRAVTIRHQGRRVLGPRHHEPVAGAQPRRRVGMDTPGGARRFPSRRARPGVVCASRAEGARPTDPIALFPTAQLLRAYRQSVPRQLRVHGWIHPDATTSRRWARLLDIARGPAGGGRPSRLRSPVRSRAT